MKVFVRTTLVWILLAFFGEMLLAPLMSIGGVAPDFIIIALVILSLAEGSFAGCIGGFVLGLVQDLANPPLLGLNALCKTILGFTLGRLRGQLVYGMPIMEGLVVALAVLAHELGYLLVESLLGTEDVLLPSLLAALPRAVYSGLVGIPLLRIADGMGVLRRGD